VLRRAGALGEDPELPPGLVRQLVRFAAVGVASTLFYLLLYTALRPAAGAQAANALALLASAVANTAANRRLTFGVRGRGGVLRHQLKGLAAFLVGLALTSGSLAVLHRTAPGADPRVELLTLILANLAATLLRFLLLRAWVFPGHRSRRTTGPSAS
jgi:putative flippase GtrA